MYATFPPSRLSPIDGEFGVIFREPLIVVLLLTFNEPVTNRFSATLNVVPSSVKFVAFPTAVVDVNFVKLLVVPDVVIDVPDEPEVPLDPLEPEVPLVPADPLEPEEPLEPEVPEEPLVPLEPDEPDEPDEPLEPEVPEEPDEPLEPEVPEEPLEPEVPEEPDEPL